MDRRVYVTAIMLAAFLVIGCGRGSPNANGVALKKGPTSKTFPLKGIVRQVDTKAGEVTISHEEIVGFMSKMTMPFNLEDKSLLEDVQPGDEVEGTLKVSYEWSDATAGNERADRWMGPIIAISVVVSFLPMLRRKRSLKHLMSSIALSAIFIAVIISYRKLVADAPRGRSLAVKSMDLVDLAVVRRPSTAQGTPVPSTETPPETLKPGDLVPDFAVTTQEGRELKLGDLKGEVVVLTFIYTRCPLPEFCPAMDSKFADLARRISTVPGRADRVRLLSISFDPEHDTPEVLAAHAARRGAKPPLWTFAVASDRELAKVASGFGLVYVPGTRDFSHNLRTAVIGPDGRLALLEVGSGWISAGLLKEVYGLLGNARK